ncbi:glycosyl hydrolase family 43 [Clavibacter michiganensis]|nr:family 43 glycosylhydrolase [Clavibacter michiganensis]PPF60633.1 glycosyl hydrolase family 43 [Clavibacter michiganensis]
MISRILKRGAAAVVSLAVIGTGLSAAGAASAAVPTDGLIGEYVFSQTSGATVANQAAGAGALDAATVVNGSDDRWTGDSLQFSGGPKNSAANWVRLPNDILAGKTAATISTEVKIDASMKSDFNFLWNVGNDSPTSYFFATVKDTPRTAITTASNGGEVNARATNNLDADRWYNLTSVIDGTAGTISFYVDGVKTGQTNTSLTPASITDQSLNAIGRSPWPDGFFAGEVSTFRVYDRALAAADVTAISDQDAAIHSADMAAQAQAILDGLDLADRTVDAGYVALPTAGGAVSWTTSDEAIVAPDGRVTQPSEADGPATVTATATSTVRGVSASTSITLTVLPTSDQERVDAAAAGYVLPPVVISGTALPSPADGTSVVLQNAQGVVVAANGTLTAPDAADASAAVTGTVDAVISRTGTPGVTVTKTFTVRVLPAGSSKELLSYQRTPTSANMANNADVALSMHLALPSDGAAWTPLNENYGIFFPKTSATPPPNGTSNDIIRSLVNPQVFALGDGGYGVISTRTAREGASDGSQKTSVLIATSADLLSYDEVGLLDLGETNGVNAPHAVYDSAADVYVIAWTDDSGTPKYTTVADLSDAATRGDIVAGVINDRGAVPTASGIDDYVAGRTVPVDAATIKALEERFGRITNTGYTPFGDVEASLGADASTLELPTDVALEYSDGSTGSLPVATWDTSAVDTSKPGTYTVTGTVKQTEYPRPFADERADPSVYKYDFNGTTKYLMIATNDLYGSNVDQQGAAMMPIRIADSISGLSDAAGAQEIDLLKRGDTDAQGNAMTGCFWAPEYHEIDGRLSILFMPCYGSSPDMWSGRASIMQLKQDASGADLDPAIPANWTKPSKVLRADGSDLNQVNGLSLDMTFFQDETGQAYYVWQHLGALFIAKVDPANPTRLTTDPVRILAPEYAWDNTIAEGPNVITRDGRLQLIYSGSTVGDTYTTGLATADASGATDLTTPEAWSKLNYPIQKSGVFDGALQLGTGHGMWSEDEDGNMIYVFHARTDNNNLSGRDMFVRRVHWSAEGLPVLDMEPGEELASPTVTLNVVVADGTVVPPTLPPTEPTGPTDPTSPVGTDGGTSTGSTTTNASTGPLALTGSGALFAGLGALGLLLAGGLAFFLRRRRA